MVNKKNKTTSVRQRTHENVDKIMDKAESIKENVDDYIKKNSKKSLLIAAGIGAVIGVIFATRRRR